MNQDFARQSELGSEAKQTLQQWLSYFKSLEDPRGEQGRKHSFLSVVTAWANEHRLIFGQVKVNTKSNEITAIPQLLNLFDLTGCIIMRWEHKPSSPHYLFGDEEIIPIGKSNERLSQSQFRYIVISALLSISLL